MSMSNKDTLFVIGFDVTHEWPKILVTTVQGHTPFLVFRLTPA